MKLTRPPLFWRLRLGHWYRRVAWEHGYPRRLTRADVKRLKRNGVSVREFSERLALLRDKRGGWW